MLTKERIVVRMSEIEQQAEEMRIKSPTAYLKDRQYTKIQEEYSLLSDIKEYFKTNYSVGYYNKEYDRINSLLLKIDSEFDLWRSFQKASKTIEEFKAEYDRIKNVKTLKNQLNTVNYILNF